MSLVSAHEHGVHCAAGGFFVDPSRPVPLAVVTHAHGDHVQALQKVVVASRETAALASERVSKKTRFVVLPPREERAFDGVRVSLFPSGHMLGASMVLIAGEDETVLVTGDLKRDADPTCAPCDVPRCDTLVCEATFADPRFVWPEPEEIATAILAWVRACRAKKLAAVLLCHALGKAQRILALLGAELEAPPFAQRTIRAWNERYAALGVALPACEPIPSTGRPKLFQGRLVLAPQGAFTPSLRSRLGACSVAVATGWALDPERAAATGAERAFCLSDHADYGDLVRTIEECHAKRVRFVHGDSTAIERDLRARGVDARSL